MYRGRTSALQLTRELQFIEVKMLKPLRCRRHVLGLVGASVAVDELLLSSTEVQKLILKILLARLDKLYVITPVHQQPLHDIIGVDFNLAELLFLVGEMVLVAAVAGHLVFVL